MSAWRRKALALFPEARELLKGREEDLWELFNRLEERTEQAHRDNDEAFLRKVHGFAEWCLHQGDHLWEQAAIGFYEDLFAELPWEQLVPWLSPFVVEQVKKTWALGGRREREPEFDRLVESRTEHAYRTHAYATGELERV